MTPKTYFAFVVRGVPAAQPRPRAVRRGLHAGVYNPKTAEAWKRAVVAAGAPWAPPRPLMGPLRVKIDLFFPRPKRGKTGTWKITRPDRDNCEKAILDAMTGAGWWGDDAQVVAGEVRKFFTPPGQGPCASISVEALEDDPC